MPVWPSPITDGGGCQSSADWLTTRVAVDNFKELRLRFGRLAREWNVASRLTAHVEAQSCSSLFTSKEIEVVQGCFVEFLCGKGFACNGDASPHQPFLLDVWGALAQLTDDIDAVLPAILSQGVPTGILSPIEPSGVWEPVPVPEEVPRGLLVHREPWGSAQADLDLVWSLVQKDIAFPTAWW